MLSDSDGSDSEDLHRLTINEHYAKAFEYKKEREELQKLKDKYGSDFEESDLSKTDSESDETEDEDGEELTPTVDAAILRTLAKIRRKDPDIYDSEKNIFGEEESKIEPVRVKRKGKNKSKPVTLRQVALEAALRSGSRSPSPVPLTHVEEQRLLRHETIAVFNNAIDDSDDVLVPREKTKDEQERDEEDYKAFLERQVGEDLHNLLAVGDGATITDVHNTQSSADGKKGKEGEKKSSKNKQARKSSGNDASGKPSKEDADQDFLLNYILNRGWIDRSAKHIPTYKEVLGSEGGGESSAWVDINQSEGFLPTHDADIDEDDFDEIVDRFESSYNFRFEEPDAAVIKTYPRNLPATVRREDTKRKEARERRKQRKEEELQKKREEVKRLKGLKMKEIRTKLEWIGVEGGKSIEDDPALQALDLEADWDPEAHDKQMAELYGGDDGQIDDEKPHWEDDIDIGDIKVSYEDDEPVKTKKKKKKKKKDKNKDEFEDPEVGIDATDADDANLNDDEWDGTEEMRKRRLEEYMDELYKLDFNDMVGGMPTKFRYMPVLQESFALTPVEILMASDKELNEYMSIKKYAPYRKGVKWDSKRNERLQLLKEKIAARMAPEEAGIEEAKPAKKRKGKKERQKVKGTKQEDDAGVVLEETSHEHASTGKRKRSEDDREGQHGRKRRKRKKQHADADDMIR